MEHLRSGWNSWCQQFVKHLFKYVYKISIMQLTPNGVKWISRFLSCCDKAEFQPTFKLFHQLFVLIQSNHLPLYEIGFRTAESAMGRDKLNQWSCIPHLNSGMVKILEWWGYFLKGLDLSYMPHLLWVKKRKISDPQLWKAMPCTMYLSFVNAWASSLPEIILWNIKPCILMGVSL